MRAQAAVTRAQPKDGSLSVTFEVGHLVVRWWAVLGHPVVLELSFDQRLGFPVGGGLIWLLQSAASLCTLQVSGRQGESGSSIGRA